MKTIISSFMNVLSLGVDIICAFAISTVVVFKICYW